MRLVHDIAGVLRHGGYRMSVFLGTG
jgi:hypothetical protein